MGCGSSLQKNSVVFTENEIVKGKSMEKNNQTTEKNPKTIEKEKQQNGDSKNVYDTEDAKDEKENSQQKSEKKEEELKDQDDNSDENDLDMDVKLYELTIRQQNVDVKPESQEALDNCKSEITRAMEFLQNVVDFKNEQILISIEVIKKSYSKWTKYRPLLGQHLCNVGFPSLFTKYWIELNKLDLFDQENVVELKVFKAMNLVAWNYSDASVAICEELGKAGAVPLLLSSFTQNELLPDVITNPVIIHVKSSLGILNNMVRLFPDNIQILRDNDAVKKLLDYSSVKFLILKANCFIILSFLITDDEVSLLENMGTAVGFIINLLTTSLTSGKARGYSTSEILLALNNLAGNDENKVKIVVSNGLAQLDRGLKKNAKSILILSSMLCWKLAFIQENRVKMRKEQSLIDGLKRLKNSESHKLKATCAGALWEIFEGQPEEQLSEDSPVLTLSQKHVMLSYQWDVQPRIIQLKQKLQNAGYNVWMDIDQMEGDILGAMADAVENAAVILTCISKKYKDSTSCRTEATYAYKQNKAIIPLIVEQGYVADGWLGALIGTLIYFPMFDDSKLETEINRIVSEIGDRGKMQKGQQTEHTEIIPVATSIVKCGKDSTDSPFISAAKVAVAEMVSMTITPPTAAKTSMTAPTTIAANNTTNIAGWTTSDVEKWLKKVKLEECRSAMENVDGDILIQMYKMSKDAPEFFYSRLERDFDMTHLLQVLKFKSALEKLICPGS
ncbi:uncharacterized protein [Antedon mediterranea]|uniref:uncharacterized protein n=1 Tax=Antedon mediterranea TaxID=105859 RepID=UPI003AF66823